MSCSYESEDDECYGYEDDLKDLTEEEEKCMFEIHPDEWNEVSPTTDFKVFTSEGRNRAWSTALDELGFVRANMFECCGKDRMNVDGTFENEPPSTPPRHASIDTRSSSRQMAPSESEIVDIYFGNKSQLFQVFQDELAWSYSKFIAFICTALLTSYFSLSIKELHNPELKG